MQADHRQRCAAGKRQLAHHHLEQHGPDGIEIGAAVQRLAPCLFRGHVLGRAADLALLGGQRSEIHRRTLIAVKEVVRINRLGQSKIAHLDEIRIAVAFNQDDVVGFEIAVDDPQSMRGADGVQQLTGDPDGPRRRQRSVGAQARRQRRPHQPLHDQVCLACLRAPVRQHLDRVGVAQGLGALHLAQEALPGRRRLRLAPVEDLHRYRTVGLAVAPLPHRGGGTVAQLRPQLITLVDDARPTIAPVLVTIVHRKTTYPLRTI